MRSSTLFDGGFDRPTDGLLLLDASLVIIEANAPFLSSANLDLEDVLGKALYTLSSDTAGDAERLRMLREGRSKTGARFTFMKAGKIKYSCLILLVPLAAEGDEPGYLGLVHRDSAAEAGERIQVDRRVLWRAIDRVADPLLITHAVSRQILEANRGFEFLSGWNTEELRGRPLRSLFCSDDQFTDFVSRQKRKSHASSLYLGRWKLNKKNGCTLTCAVICLNFFATTDRKPATLYVLLDRQDEEYRIQKLTKIAEEYREVILELKKTLLPLHIQDGEKKAPEQGLTRRQAEIARLLTQGYSSKEIAHALFISETTVRNHLSILYKRFGVPSRMALSNELKRLGLLN